MRVAGGQRPLPGMWGGAASMHLCELGLLGRLVGRKEGAPPRHIDIGISENIFARNLFALSESTSSLSHPYTLLFYDCIYVRG